MATWLIELYLKSGVQIPGALLQPLLTFATWFQHVAYQVLRLNYLSPPESTEIAEKSQELMALHYDMPLPLFHYMLGPSMKYSMALWEQGATNLEEAQEAMLADLCGKAQITDGDTILDIGCGFGSLVAYLLKAYPKSEVYGLNLSKVQAAYMRAKQEEEGHVLNTDRFHLIEADFNTVELPRRFDRILSIGAFEHVSNLALGLRKVRELLTDSGVCVLHCIVYFEALYMRNTTPLQNAFLARYIFPGGRVRFENDMQRFQDDLVVDKSWMMAGINYRRTLEAWVDNLHRHRRQIQAEAGLDRRALKMWDFYLRGCASLFGAGRGRYYGNGQYLLRPRN